MVPIVYARDLRDDLIARAIDECDVIGIDEIQFFAMYDDERARDVVRIVDEWVARGKIVICAGLDSDYMRRPFAVVAPLVAMSTRITKLLAVCSQCGADAMFSARTCSDDATYSDPVGGANKYVALCRACYIRNTH
jgi:thymidine kinase